MTLVCFRHFTNCLRQAALSRNPAQRVRQCNARYQASDWLSMVRFDEHAISHKVGTDTEIITFGTVGTEYTVAPGGMAVALCGLFDEGDRGSILTRNTLVSRAHVSAVVRLDPSSTSDHPLLFR